MCLYEARDYGWTCLRLWRRIDSTDLSAPDVDLCLRKTWSPLHHHHHHQHTHTQTHTHTHTQIHSLTITSSSSSSSDRVDSRGPLRQPRVATRTSLGPFSTNAEGVPSPICWIQCNNYTVALLHSSQWQSDKSSNQCLNTVDWATGKASHL